MSERIKEQLSAMMDDCLPAGEEELLLARMAGDRELVAQWHRYHLIRSALRQELPEDDVVSIAAQVREALDGEPALRPKTHAGLPAWLKPLAGLAVAASVAAIAVLGVRNHQPDSSPAVVATVAPGTEDPAVEFAGPVVRVRGIHWNVATPRVENRLNNYLVNHGEYAASSGMPAIGPHVRIVGYDAGR